MFDNPILKAIKERRSIRKYTVEKVPESMIQSVLEAGSWAPSGLNNQPWRFVIVEDAAIRNQMAACTRYASIIRSAPVNICVFLDTDKLYNRDKDLQGIGACLQNMLLAAHSLGLGAVWLGEILNQKEKVREMLGLATNLELMAVISMGFPENTGGPGNRVNLEDLIVKRI
ncbi:nitroreductase [Desulfofarcimen acetoxidans DSM 771]|uniref:Nitroreductase n=1 Tax=Desulfofarcimen acetoxidans (strain ATCC 49208 / DSM 771 / KCTC 5769 / VKM B-1644 / 5575) TaxID=485916 RepID=C8W083_DESAS|nr:nitroreductase [Desulfofarcimen acetoxidans]ACV63138.1 nitroreductase [Desulfofarcimen acetoxidans DSM 771]